MRDIKRLKMISFLVNIEDVTKKVNSLASMTGNEKAKEIIISREILRIKDEIIKNAHYDEKVYSRHIGNKYYIYILKFFWIYQ